MSYTLEDTLESDWVAVRPNVFEEKGRQKFVFIVAWNEVEGKFAITCHNRTAQRQRTGDRGASQSPARHPGGSPDSSPSKRDKPQAASPAKTPGEPSREEQQEEDCSWAGLFSFQDLRAVHQQLCSVNCELEPCLPAFPEEPSGMWSVLFGAPEMGEEQVEELCCHLQRYLGHALDTCGWKILSQVLFTESDDPEEYYESLSELRHKGYEEVLQRARRRLQELVEKHKNTESMVELLALYQMEDEAYGGLVEATTEMYQYLLQPFRDMRELATLRRQRIKISIENDYLGPRRIESLKKEDADWQKKAHAAVLSIQDLTVKYFEITAKAQKAVLDRMRADQKKFGRTAWAAAVERMEKLQYGVSKETLQLMRAKEICLEQKKHALKEEMQGLQGGPEAIPVLDQLEADYYAHQLQLYEVQFEILKCEELLLTAQLESIKRQISERTDEVVYYDTYESMEAMLSTENMAASLHLQREEVQKRQLKVRQLEAKRGRISAKKAYLRNKKEICIAKHNEKIQQRLHSDEKYQEHHAAQLQDEEEQKSIWVSEERQKTLDRLRTFKQRYPGQVILKSTRLRLAHSRRKATAHVTPSVDEPQSLSVGIQTQGISDVGGQDVLQPLKDKNLESLGQLEDNSLPPDLITSGLPQMTSLPILTQEKLDLEINTVQLHSLPTAAPPPPPPPPPPPLPPPKEEMEPLEIRVIHVKKEADESTDVKSVPLSQLFDSSQLLSARKKLKKTGALEGIQRRKVSSPMDEVLASLKRGSFHLKKVEQRTLAPFPDEDDGNNILAQIRKGVKLKKVQKEALRESFTLLSDADPLTRSIHEALRRIKEASPESEDEEESLPFTDWEN